MSLPTALREDADSVCPPASALPFGRVGDWPAWVCLVVGESGTFPKLSAPCPLCLGLRLYPGGCALAPGSAVEGAVSQVLVKRAGLQNAPPLP